MHVTDGAAVCLCAVRFSLFFFAHVLRVLALQSLPHTSGCWCLTGKGWNEKTAARCQEQPSAWLPSNSSLRGHKNCDSESVNGSVGGEHLKHADVFVLKKRRWVVDIHCNTSSSLFYFCDLFCQARPEVSRRLRSLWSFFASCLWLTEIQISSSWLD